MTYHGHDIYCDLILSGKLEVERVFETESVLAFHHTRPFWPVHIVVIPKRHIPSVLEAEDDAMLELLAVVRRVAAQVVAEQGACRILTNLGAYQESKHLHWHVSAGEPLRG